MRGKQIAIKLSQWQSMFRIGRLTFVNTARPSWLGLVIGISAFGLLQLSVVPNIWFFKIKPDLLLVSTIYISLNSTFSKAFVFALCCGLFKDTFSLYLFGFNSISFCGYAVLLNLISRHIYGDTFGIRFLLVAGLTMLNYVILTIIFNRPYFFLGLAESALNCLFLPLIVKFYPAPRMPPPLCSA